MRAEGGATAAVAATKAPAPQRRPLAVRWLMLAIALAVAAGWAITRATGLQASSPVAYWLGVIGGSAMLFTFAYPLRKRIPLLRTWGAAKYWFAVHMTCGIGGPLLVIVHTGYAVGSINAAVALTSMLLVAGSGIVGRFIYLHIHRGWSGAHLTLTELEAKVGFDAGEVHSKLSFAPRVEDSLLSFRRRAFEPGLGPWRRAWRFVALPMLGQIEIRRCVREIDIAFEAKAAALKWDASAVRRRRQRAHRLIRSFVEAVINAAQFQTYERLFALWHVLHVPLVWMLVVSAIAHVVAVHVY